jgi:hypothetical protein
LSAYTSTCDFLLSTVTADLPWGEYVQVLRPGGKLCLVGSEHQLNQAFEQFFDRYHRQHEGQYG